MSELKRIQPSFSRSKDIIFLKYRPDVLTSWNSIYSMLTISLELKNALYNIKSTNYKIKMGLNDSVRLRKIDQMWHFYRFTR